MGGPDGRDAVEDILKHYGVKGMRWGFRRNSSGQIVRTGKRVASPDHTQARELQKKRVSELSNTELEALTKRLNLERNYKNLVKDQRTQQLKENRDNVKLMLELADIGQKVYRVARPAASAVRTALG